MTPSPKIKLSTNSSYPKIFFLNTRQNIEIQNFEPPKMGQAYVYMKISEYAHPSLWGLVVSNGPMAITLLHLKVPRGKLISLSRYTMSRVATIHWNRIVSRYAFWRYAYRIVRSFHDTLTIQQLVLYIRYEFKDYMFLYKRNVTIFPLNFSAWISKPFSMLKLLIYPVLKQCRTRSSGFWESSWP